MNRIAVFIATSLLASSAFAADPVAKLSSAQGTVSVNQGEEFVSGQTGQALKPGDRIMTAADSMAKITFEDGCDLSLDASSLLIVPEISTCAGGIADIKKVGEKAVTNTTIGESVNLANAAMVVAPVAVVGAVALSNDDEDDTASP